MKIDFASLAFGYSVRVGGGTPNWATSLGQGIGYKINLSDDINELLKGLIYSSISLSMIESKIGKGGRVIAGNDPDSPIILAALFNKVYINEELINEGRYILLLTRDTSKSHSGRLRLKYGPSITFKFLNETFSNEEFFNRAKKQLKLADDACFFVSEINIVNQSELILKTFIVDKDHSVEYEDSESLHKAWEEMADFNIDIPKSNDYDLLQNKELLLESIKDSYSIEELGDILNEMYINASNKTTAIHIFGIKYGEIIKRNGYSSASIIECTSIDSSYNVEVSKGVRIYESILNNEYGVKFCEDDMHQVNNSKIKILPSFPKRSQKTYSLNQILYGAPGTGKTYSTAQYALAIIENKRLTDVKTDTRFDVMNRYNSFIENGQAVFTTFHQNYGYEDFIQGIRPDISSNEMVFKIYDGVFKIIAEKALMNSNKNYVIIIDEINRANISKVFGELITLIEDDKRWGEENAVSVTLPTGDIFVIPNNLYIIGTMNSADKSISLIDTALRRRFQFIEFLPDINLISDTKLKEVFKKLNDCIEEQLNSSDLLVGHSYFMGKSIDDLGEIMNQNIIPLLYEYFFDDKAKVEAQIKHAINDTNYIVKSASFGRLQVEKKAGSF